jgi:Tol biopolymer transport system component
MPGRSHAASPAAGQDQSVRRLAEEVRGKGWIVYSARSEKGDWDLFLCRPDGSSVRNLTNTEEFSEAAPQFSRDGRRLLYRRLKKGEKLDNNQHGAQGALVFAHSDGTSPVVFGADREYPWASWGPDGKQIVTLSIKGISFVEIAARRVVRTLPRKGFFQQLTWSPDGRGLSGVANSFGTEWTVACMDASSGTANAVSRFQCCTPDWFPDSRALIFSSRPPEQKTNNGYGWTQLWMADAEGKERRLVYGEDGRHVYGGHVSPDGRYVLFTGNMEEDGDPGNAGAPMALMRLADAPIIGGESKALRALHPNVKDGPVLPLPSGWEPCWTSREVVEVGNLYKTPQNADESSTSLLAVELRDKGWIAYSAPTGQGDWDLFVMRPDGSDRRHLTNSREYNEAGVRFAPDGTKMLYYRMPKATAVDNNTYGTFELVVADADGRNPAVLGGDFHWASWSPDGKQLACLDKSGIRVVELSSRKTARQMPRKGIVQQLAWSPDGKALAGTANGLGPFWNIARLDLESGAINAVSETERYNCTPDWLPDSRRVIYSRGIVPEKGGFAELWVADADGANKRLLYGEEQRHMYGGCVSPDGRYLLFTRSEVDLGTVDNSRTSLSIIRMADAPMIGGQSPALRKQYAEAKNGPRLDLSWGWEPHWTYAEPR